MINSRKTLLEKRIARLEKLLSDSTKSHRVNESIPRSGMTLGEIFCMLMGDTNKRDCLKDIASTTDIHYQVADVAGLDDELEGLDWISEQWWDQCDVKVNRGMGGGGSDEVIINVAGITIELDWLDEDDEAYEAKCRAERRRCRR